jgi:HK97 gp10 family phage protein
MAKMECVLPNELIEKLTQLADRTDEVLERALEAGGEVVLACARSKLASAIGKTKYKSRSTGTLAGALGVSPMKIDNDGMANVRIGFSEPRRGGGSNAMIGSIFENGKSSQPPHPFMKPAASASKAAAVQAISAVIEREFSQ